MKMENQESLLKMLNEHSNSHVCFLEEKGLLSHSGKTLKFQSIDKILFRLSNLTLDKGKRILFLYPISRREILLPLCVDLLYNLMDKEGSRKRILLYTDLLKFRYLYPEFRTQFMSFNEQFPVGLSKLDGSLKAAVRISTEKLLRDVDPKLVIANSPELFPGDAYQKEIGAIVVDLSSVESMKEANELIKFADRNKIDSIIFFGTDVHSPVVRGLMKNEMLAWTWNESMIKNEIERDSEIIEKNPEAFENPFSCSVTHIINLVKGISREFVLVKDENITPLLNEARKFYSELKGFGDSEKNSAITRLAIKFIVAIYSLERMLSPYSYIEQECKTSYLAKSFEERIDNMNRLIGKMRESDKAMASALTKASELVESLVELFEREDENGKSRKMLEIVEESFRKNKKALIITPTEPYRRATVKFLSSKLSIAQDDLKAKGVFVASIDSLLPSSNYDICIFFGQVPYRKMHLLKITSSQKVLFLCYDTELATIKRQVEWEIRGDTEFAGKSNRSKTLKSFLPDITSKEADVLSGDKSDFIGRTDKFAEELEVKNIFSSMLTEDLLIEEEEYFSDDEDIDEEMVTDKGNMVTEAIKFIFNDGAEMYCRKSKHLPVLTESKVVYKEAEKVLVGDRIMVIDNDLRKSLTDTIFARAASHPRMERLRILIGSWKNVLNEGKKRNSLSDAEVLAKLKQLGSRISHPIAVCFWSKGYVIGPRDPKDIQRIGQIFKEQTLVDNYREIAQAATRIRGIHIKLIRQLNKVLIDSALKGSDGDDIIDDEFNLYLEDFINSVSIHKIKVMRKESAVPLSKLDRIMRK